jgi:hypothetical protein
MLRRFWHGGVLVVMGSAMVVLPGARAAAPDGGPSAAAILHQAEEQAQAEHKNILLTFGASWCVNCRLYDRFLADPEMHAVLSRAFVFASMDTGEQPRDTKHANTPGGLAFEDSVGGKDAGWPFLVVLNAEGKPIVNSDRPNAGPKPSDGNIGYPVAPEEVAWFVEMLRRGAPGMSEQDLASVRTWLKTHGPK